MYRCQLPTPSSRAEHRAVVWASAEAPQRSSMESVCTEPTLKALVGSAEPPPETAELGLWPPLEGVQCMQTAFQDIFLSMALNSRWPLWTPRFLPPKVPSCETWGI